VSESTIHQILLWALIALGVISFLTLFFVTAPYGRHAKTTWGPTIDNRLGWLIMESPSSLVFLVCWFLAGKPADSASLLFLLLWQLHYAHRAFIYPFRLDNNKKRMPVVVMLMALLFTTTNAYLNGRWLFSLSPTRNSIAITHPHVLVGALIFLIGYAINQHADWVLLHLRKPGEAGYKIPHGGLYRWITCPNYFGEIIEWFGFAICTMSFPALVFALWTVANLLPRARSHHLWYQKTFPDYPPTRKALIPGIF
jgi:3-oxo-5-alpha-steroid 4-dehydrogenase 1